jgi:ArsR family transcriptional regulator
MVAMQTAMSVTSVLQDPLESVNPLDFFKLLADETRLHALLLIAQQGELCVCELMSALNESQPKISRHLAMLRSAKVLLDRRQGQWVFYRLNPALPAWAHSTLQQTLAQNSTLVKPLLQNLCAMGERPLRQQACC